MSLYILLFASLSLTGLLIGEFKQIFPLKAACKTLTALSFIFFSYMFGWESSYHILIFSGLVLSFLGDVFLIPKNKKTFLVGLIFFLLAHVVYGFAFIPSRFPSFAFFLISLIPIGGSILFYRWIFPKLDRFKIPVGVYLVVINFMLLASLAIFLESGRSTWGQMLSTRTGLALAGAFLFYLSDLAVARERFVQRSFINKLWGLPFYFVGQFMIAYSVNLSD
jgi:uncharacterized membrane protein YhhN